MASRLARYSTLTTLCFGALLTATLAAAQEPQRGQGRPGGGPGGGWMFGGNGNPPVAGSVTAVGTSEFTVKTAEGEVYKITYSVNTRFIKDRQPAKANDVKLGDTIIAAGVVDAKAKSVAAAFVAELDPEQAKQIQQAQASYGKTWLGGKVASIDE